MNENRGSYFDRVNALGEIYKEGRETKYCAHIQVGQEGTILQESARLKS